MTVKIFQNIFDSVQAPLSVHSWARLNAFGAPFGVLFRCFLCSFLGVAFWVVFGSFWDAFGGHCGPLLGSQVIPKWLLKAIFCKKLIF